MDFNLLHRIYHFPGVDIPADQGEGTCAKLADLFVQFSKLMAEENRHNQEPKSGHTQPCYDFASESLKNAMQQDLDSSLLLECSVTQEKYLAPSVKWFPEYGCAILFHSSPDHWSSKLCIDVIGLDGHDVEVHPGKESYQYTSKAKSYAILHVGEISVNDKKMFYSCFEKLFQERMNRKGGERSAAGGKQGHQKTPAFIHAVSLQALMSHKQKGCSCPDIQPKGGFTDVGLHTGGQKRDTCYALARSVFQFFLDQGSSLSISPLCHGESCSFDPVMVHFHIYILEKAVLVLDDIDALINSKSVQPVTDARIEYIFHMFTHVAVLAARLSDDGYDLQEYYARMESIHDRIHDSLSKWDQATWEKNSWTTSDFNPNKPDIEMPDYIPPQITGELSPEALQSLIEQNIGLFSRPVSNSNLKESAVWARRQVVEGEVKKSNSKLFAFLRNIEHIFWTISEESLKESAVWARRQVVQGEVRKSNSKLFAFLRNIEHIFWTISEESLTNQPLAIDTLGNIMEMIDCYREALQSYSQSNSAGKSTLLNRMRSVELLLIWVGYCVIFNSVLHAHPAMTGFGVCLHYKDLKCLLLHDTTQLMVMERVATFLHDHHVHNQELFSARDDHSWTSPTFNMGERYANTHFQSIWSKERDDAEQRVDKHWREVQRKQELARRLRQDLSRLQSDLSYELPKVDDYDYRGHRTYAGRLAQNEVKRLRRCIEAKEREIKDAEKAPPPVIQPLPNDMVKAMKVLFFMYMPDEFQYLSRLSYTAQQGLVLTPWKSACGGSDGVNVLDTFLSLKVNKEIHDWKAHYDVTQNCCHHRPYEHRSGKILDVGLSMHHTVPEPETIGPNHVDRLTCRTDGVWYPDQSNVRLVWKGGKQSWDHHDSGKEFNPFRIDDKLTASYFTEKLDSKYSKLQWSLIVLKSDDDPPTHGNRPYASQDIKPSLLSKEGFLDYCSARRFPRMALRKLCCAMKRGSLPLEHEFVQKLVRQTLYQVGNLRFTTTNGFSLQMEWRENDIVEICKAYIPILQQMSDIQIQRPHLCKASAMIGEISSYFSCLPRGGPETTSFRDISMNLAEAAIKWADDYEEEIAKASPEKRPSLRSKQVIFFRIGMMCVVHGEIDDSIAEIMLKCIVRSQNSFVRDDDESLERNALKNQCEYILTNKLHDYLTIIARSKGGILSKGLRAVIGSAPISLDWNQELNSHTCFTAKDTDGQWYSVNVLTGVVLVNGLPPNQLPSSITGHRLYQKIFSTNNFEVTLRSGFFETTHPVFGCYYRFHMSSDALVVQESRHKGKTKNGVDPWSDPLELLDLNHLHLLDQYPKKLQSSFSHWGYRNHGTIVFRSFDFREREIFYIHNPRFKMKCVPVHMTGRDDWEILASKEEEMDSLVIHRANFLDILKRLEKCSMMITRNTRDDKYCVRLHRFALEFCFDRDCETYQCSEVTGYHLRQNQHLRGHLRGLHQLLILDSDDGKKTKVIIPFGNVAVKRHKGVEIHLLHSIDGILHPTKNEKGAEEEMHFFTYEVHPRFGTLLANSLSSRLFLAGLYIATSSCVQDKKIGMTGEAKAIELLRHCVVNRQLSIEEKHCLENVKGLSESRSPTAYLLCHDIEQNCNKYAFLHVFSDDAETDVEINSLRCSDEGTVYMTAANKPLSSRLLLTEEECQRCLGVRNLRGWKRSHRVIRHQLELDDCPVERDTIIDEIRQSLDKVWEEEEHISQASFPLSTSYKTPLEEFAFGELEASWKMHCKEKKISLGPNTFDAINEVKAHVAKALTKVEKYLTFALNPKASASQSDHWHSQALQFLRLADIVPSATKQDITALACSQFRIGEFNPLLSPNARQSTYSAILLWLELCVEMDRMDFLLSFYNANDDLNGNTAFIEELVATRKWSIKQHPYWLVFEAEQGIRIRPEQYEVANHLIHNNGAAIQLNMGRGKTRVILPMLILFWSFSTNITQTPRLILLSKLLREGCDYFHNVLCGTILGRRLFVLPFQRDVEIDNIKVELLQDMVKHCRRERGFFVVAPEHRLSMELKVKELHLGGNNDLGGELHSVLSSAWCDIIDEVDEVLHHRFQLVYSTGAVQPLPQGRHRWEAIEALLETLKKAEINGLQVTQNSEIPEAFPWITIDDDIDIPVFRQHLVDLLFKDPPFRFGWLKGHSKSELISRIMTIPKADPKVLHLSEEHLYDVLSVRGLLAFDILLHCLRKRHRVDFGVNKDGKKSLSVPFRGADTPSERAEFSHPDCAIVYTILAYYDHGLNRHQTEKAFEFLLQKGKNARADIYDEWLSASKHRIEEDTLESISNVNKIDLTNTAQSEVLFQYFHRNPGTINLWLNSCIFPSEIDQYPQRLVANSWHLTNRDHDEHHCVGFSGTNDNHQILPLRIKQYLPWNISDRIWRNLLATNGRMLDIMIKKTSSCEELEAGRAHESLLSYIKSRCAAKDKPIDALIDSGALLAGRSNRSVAQSILNECLSPKSTRLRGVTFFDEERNAWVILETSGRCMNKEQSPLMEKDTFALFDEPRCRGVDLKLRPDAVAVLTLGQNICKDKVMQAAGRMRQLSRGQSIVIVGEGKVFNEIRRVNKSLTEVKRSQTNVISRIMDTIRRADVTIEQILSWVMHNTIESIWKGLGTWSEQGIFHTTASKPEHALFDEHMDLIAFYGKPIHEAPVSELAASAKAFHCERSSGGDKDVMDEIMLRCHSLGSSYQVMRTGVDEECERELEREIEQEEEEEKETSRMTARGETDWNYSSILKSESAQKLPLQVYDITYIMQNYMSCESLVHINWSNQVFCSKNFIKTIKLNEGLDDFLRIPDSLVHFPNGDVLLLSEREANQVLPLFQNKESNSDYGEHYFGHYSFENEKESSPFLRCGKKGAMPDDMACTMKLFNGETMYPGSQQRTLKNILSGAMEYAASGEFKESKASGEPEHIVSARRKDADLDRSDLERICTELACEMEMG